MEMHLSFLKVRSFDFFQIGHGYDQDGYQKESDQCEAIPSHSHDGHNDMGT